MLRLAMLARHALSLVLLGSLTGGATVPVMQASLPPGGVGSSSSALAARIVALLPLPGQAAQVMKNGSRLTVVDLQDRVIAAGGSREALRNVLAVIARGEIPTYDERLGISRAEFGKYLAFQPIVVPTGKVFKLPLLSDGQRLVFGDAPGLNGVFKGISFDLRTAELRVPEGFIIKPVAVSPSNAPDRTLDIRSGFVWNIKASYNPETQSGIKGQLSLFQLSSGQVIMGYKRTSMIRGTLNEGELLIGYQR